MDPQPFEVVRAHMDGYVRVKFRGDLDYHTTMDCADLLREVTDLPMRVVLDLAEVPFIDSAGISYLVGLANAHGGRLRLENVPPTVARVLTMTGLSEVFDFDF